MIGNDPTVSIVVPCYNCEQWVQKTVDSVLNQTYRNIKLILIDDCSKDNTCKLLENIARKDSRVLLIRNSKNMGTARSRNIGLKYIDSTYYAPSDHDDIWDLTKTEKQVRFLETNPTYAAVGCQVKVIDGQDCTVLTRNYPTQFPELKRFMTITSPICNPASLVRVAYFRNVGFCYDESISGVEDYDLWFRLSTKYKIANLDEYLYSYRITNSQQTANMTKHILLLSQRVQRRWIFKRSFYNNGALLTHLAKYLLLVLPKSTIYNINKKLNYRKM